LLIYGLGVTWQLKSSCSHRFHTDVSDVDLITCAYSRNVPDKILRVTWRDCRWWWTVTVKGVAWDWEKY